MLKKLGGMLKDAAAYHRKPDVGSGKMKNVTRYVTGSDPTKKAKMPIRCPENK